jgi:hypothetical protein
LRDDELLHDRITRSANTAEDRSDGRFELRCRLSGCFQPFVGDEPYWKDELDTNDERCEFDVGDVCFRWLQR